MDNWSFYQITLPYGENNEYNFATVNIYRGEKMLAGHFEGSMSDMDLSKILTPEELKLVNRTNQLRDLVKEEVFRLRNSTTSKIQKPSNVIVVNFMKSKEGSRGRDMGEIENQYWKPLHQMRVNKGLMEDWAIYSKEFPYGTSTEYNACTVDGYKDMEQMLTEWYDEAEFKKVHPNLTIDEISRKTYIIRDLKKAEVWKLVDYTSSSSTTTANANDEDE